jgi:hypothetical protein
MKTMQLKKVNKKVILGFFLIASLLFFVTCKLYGNLYGKSDAFNFDEESISTSELNIETSLVKIENDIQSREFNSSKNFELIENFENDENTNEVSFKLEEIKKNIYQLEDLAKKQNLKLEEFYLEPVSTAHENEWNNYIDL